MENQLSTELKGKKSVKIKLSVLSVILFIITLTVSTVFAQTPVTNSTPADGVALTYQTPSDGSILTSLDGGAVQEVFTLRFSSLDNRGKFLAGLQIHRDGTTSDSDIADAVLWAEGRVFKYTFIADGVIMFKDIFIKIPNEGATHLNLLIIPSAGAESGKTMRFSIVSQQDISIGYSDENSPARVHHGDFPVRSGTFTVSRVANPALASVSVSRRPISDSVYPGSQRVLVGAWDFNVKNSATKLWILNPRLLGPEHAVQNFRLYVNGNQVRQVQDIGVEGYVRFDTEQNDSGPLLKVGSNSVLVYADVNGSPGENFRLAIWDSFDVLMLDSQYNVRIIGQSSAGALVNIIAPPSTEPAWVPLRLDFLAGIDAARIYAMDSAHQAVAGIGSRNMIWDKSPVTSFSINRDETPEWKNMQTAEWDYVFSLFSSREFQYRLYNPGETVVYYNASLYDTKGFPVFTGSKNLSHVKTPEGWVPEPGGFDLEIGVNWELFVRLPNLKEAFVKTSSEVRRLEVVESGKEGVSYLRYPIGYSDQSGEALLTFYGEGKGETYTHAYTLGSGARAFEQDFTARPSVSGRGMATFRDADPVLFLRNGDVNKTIQHIVTGKRESKLAGFVIENDPNSPDEIRVIERAIAVRIWQSDGRGREFLLDTSKEVRAETFESGIYFLKYIFPTDRDEHFGVPIEVPRGPSLPHPEPAIGVGGGSGSGGGGGGGSTVEPATPPDPPRGG